MTTTKKRQHTASIACSLRSFFCHFLFLPVLWLLLLFGMCCCCYCCFFFFNHILFINTLCMSCAYMCNFTVHTCLSDFKVFGLNRISVAFYRSFVRSPPSVRFSHSLSLLPYSFISFCLSLYLSSFSIRLSVAPEHHIQTNYVI